MKVTFIYIVFGTSSLLLLSSSNGRTLPFHGRNRGSIPLESTYAGA